MPRQSIASLNPNPISVVSGSVISRIDDDRFDRAAIKMPKRTLLTPKEFEQYVPWSIATIRRRLKAGVLPSTQSGGPGTAWLIDWDSFLESLETSESGTSNASSNDASDVNPDHAEKLSGPVPRWLKDLSKKMNRPNEGQD